MFRARFIVGFAVVFTLCSFETAASENTATELLHNKSEAAKRLHNLTKMAAQDTFKGDRGEIMAEVIKLLESATSDQELLEQAAIVTQLVARHDQKAAARAVELLIDRLPGSKGRARCELIRALGAIGPDARSAVPNLNLILSEESTEYKEFEKIHAIATLAKIESVELRTNNLELLIARLDDSRPWVRWIVADALDEIGVQSEIVKSSLLAALQDSHDSVRASAARSLSRLDYEANDVLIDVLVDLISKEGTGVYIKPRYLSEWVPTSKSVALEAVALALTKPHQISGELKSVLLECLREDDPVIRLMALKIIKSARLNDSESITAIEDMLHRETSRRNYDEAKELLRDLSDGSIPKISERGVKDSKGEQ